MAPDRIAATRAFIRAIIDRDGGAYITPDQNRQPDPALRIASIRARGVVGIGPTEAAAQADWLRQAYAGAPGAA